MKKLLKYNSNQKRVFNIEAVEQQEDNGLLKISFSSEEPYPRHFGMPVLEVIGHDDGDMDLTRLNNKAALLFNHDFDELIGVVEKAWIEAKRGYALIRLSATADKFRTMVEEGILTKVSFGYEITDMVQIGTDDETPIVRVKTSPYEISLVTVPADDTVGIGRSKDEEESEEDKTTEIEIEEKKSTEEINKEVKTVEEVNNNNENNSKKFDNTNQISENIFVSTNNNNKGQQYMDKDLIEIGQKFGELELAVEFAQKGKSVVELTNAILEKRASNASQMDAGTANEMRKFSLAGFYAEQAEGKEGSNTGMAREFTQDLSVGRKTRGGFILPKAVFARDYTVAGNAGTTASVDYRNQVIDQLYNSSVVLPLVNRLPDATGYGSVKYPKLAGKNSFAFIAENVRATESNVTFDDILFTPKTIGGRVVLSRDIMKQSSVMIENIAKSELMRAKDEFVDNALLNGNGGAGWTGIFNTVGAGVVSMGTNGAALDWDKVVEFGTKIDAANANTAGLTFITNSKVVGKMKTTPIFTGFGGPILQNGQADGYKVAVSNQVASNGTKGTGTNLSSMALINGSMFHYMEWDGYELVFNPYRLGAGQVELELFLTADFQNSHPEGVVFAKDIIA